MAMLNNQMVYCMHCQYPLTTSEETLGSIHGPAALQRETSGRLAKPNDDFTVFYQLDQLDFEGTQKKEVFWCWMNLDEL